MYFWLGCEREREVLREKGEEYGEGDKGRET